MSSLSYGSRNEEEQQSFVPTEGSQPKQRSTKRTALLAASVGILGATGAYVSLHDPSQPHVASINTSASLQAEFLAQASVKAKDAFTSFDALDTDANGFVTKKEFLTRLETRRDDVVARIASSNLDEELKQGILNVVKSHSAQETSCVAKIFDKSEKGAVDRDGFDFVLPIIVDLCAISPNGIEQRGGEEEEKSAEEMIGNGGVAWNGSEEQQQEESVSFRGSLNGEGDFNPLPDQATTGGDETASGQDESGSNIDTADETTSSGGDATTGGDETASGQDESGSNIDTADETTSSGGDATTGDDKTASDQDESGSNVDNVDSIPSDNSYTTGSYDLTPSDKDSTPADEHDDWTRSEDDASSPSDENIYSPAEFDDNNGSGDDSNPIFNDSTSSEQGTTPSSDNGVAYSSGSTVDDKTSLVNSSETPFALPPAVQEFNNDLTSTNQHSTARTDFETELAQKFQSEVDRHQQKLAYAQTETEKQTFLLSLIESCISNAGQKFQYDHTFDIPAAMTWMKEVCLQFPDPHHQDV